MPTLIIATHNRDKFAEMAAVLAPFVRRGGLELEGLFARGVPARPETGATLEENAVAKAAHAARATGHVALADDTGLEVDALDGAPGVYSARYAGPDASYADNCRKLLGELAGVPPERRTARFRVVMAVARPDGTVATCAGTVEGRITREARGDQGFGYDPVFYAPELGKTFGEASPAEKAAVSHRARALKAVEPLLLRALSPAD